MNIKIDKTDKFPILVKKLQNQSRIDLADEILTPILDLPDLFKWKQFRDELYEQSNTKN